MKEELPSLRNSLFLVRYVKFKKYPDFSKNSLFLLVNIIGYPPL